MDFRPDYFDSLVAFYANPADQRTIKQFAIENNISEDAIYSYKKKHSQDLWNAVENSRAQYISPTRSKLWRSIFSNMEKNFNDRKLAAQLIGDLVEHSEVKQVPLTPDEKRAKIEQIMTVLTAKKENTDKH